MMVKADNSTPWPAAPEEINPAMLDDIAARASAAMPAGKKASVKAIRAIINDAIAEHYKVEG